MYGDSQALAADPTAIFSPDSRLKGDRQLLSNREMNSHQNEYSHQQQSNSSSGLLRFRSAPSSLLSDFANGDKGLMSNIHLASQTLAQVQEMEESKPLANGCSLSSQLPPQYPRQSSSSSSKTTQLVGSSNLKRQSSSPAGLFSHLTPQNGYAALRGFGNYGVGNGTNGDVSPSSSRFRGLMNFSSGVPSSLGMLSQISEIESESVGGSCHEDMKIGNGSRDSQFYSPGYTFGSSNDSSHFQENFSVLKRDLDNHDCKLFAGVQNVELENRTRILSHHLSLPKTAGEIAEMEKLIRFQDAVPCKARAKRGCATHPRSIAERVRRTRISERMRKLQELVPSMDKQTNTAEMLDLAVEYIKDLQKQYKTLSESRANCKCSSMQKPFPNLSG